MEIKMAQSVIPGAELAIRAGFNSILYQSNLNSSANFAAESMAMMNTAKERIETFAKSNSSANAMTQLVDHNMALIEVAMQTAISAYQAISSHIRTTTEHRKRFEEELQLNMASFTIPGNLESKKLSKEHQAIRGFLKKLESYSTLFAYSGVKKITDTEDPRTRHLCALPLYAINQLEHPSASPRDLDQARIAISLFLNSKAAQSLEKTAEIFRNDNGFVIFFESLFEQQNYLNDLRAPRLILTMLLNILWNLQHPVDCKTGYSLSLNESIKLCAEFSEFLNLYLADITCEGPYEIDTVNNGLGNIIKHVEINTNKLHLGYIDEKLRQFKLKDLTNSAHLTLRALDTSLFQLIFKNNHNQPNKEAALDIAYAISIFNDLLDKNTFFLDCFDKQRKNIPNSFLANTYINAETLTAIDALIIFCHLTKKERELFLSDLNALPDGGEDARLLTTELTIFDTHYIVPIETNIDADMTSNQADTSTKTKLSAIKLIPLLTLAAADFRIKVDTRKSLRRIKETTDTNDVSPFYSGIEQIQLINNAAQAYALRITEEKNGQYFYHWSISPHLKLTPEAARSIDNLPSKQYRMTQITELLDYISELTLNYRSFLQYKSFQAFLLDCLQQVDAEYRQFAEEATIVEQLLSFDGKMDRTLKGVLLTMITQLTENLSAFRQSIDEISHIVGAPDFTELRKQELEKHLTRIEKKFFQLFGKQPINFTNACQQILSRGELQSATPDQTLKTKQLYNFTINFFNECNTELAKYRSELPPSPHFLSHLDHNKLDKYKKLIANAIQYINNLQSDNNFSLDSMALFNQLDQLKEDNTFGRTPEEIAKSTFCKVILKELKNRFIQQTTSDKRNDGNALNGISPINDDDSQKQRPTHSFISSRSASQPMLTATPPALRPLSIPNDPSKHSLYTPSPSDQDIAAQQSSKAFVELKKELKAIMQSYVLSKTLEIPTHWFLHMLHAFENWIGQFCYFIRIRLLDTKLAVAKKLSTALESADNDSKTKLVLSTEEMDTLSHGMLGYRTYYFRTHTFWKMFIQEKNTDEKQSPRP